MAAEQGIQHGPQAIHVARGPELIDPALGLFGAHVGRRAERRAGRRLGRAGQPDRRGRLRTRLAVLRSQGLGALRVGSQLRATRGPARRRDPDRAARPAASAAKTFARPQSTTSDSLNGPSRTFAGFRSRWSTPRLWA